MKELHRENKSPENIRKWEMMDINKFKFQKPLHGKWMIFKIKQDETHKARLVMRVNKYM